MRQLVEGSQGKGKGVNYRKRRMHWGTLKRERENTLAIQRKKSANNMGKRGVGKASAIRVRNTSVNVGKGIQHVNCPNGECVRKNKIGKGCLRQLWWGDGHWSANKGRKKYVYYPKEKCVKCFLWEGGGKNAQQSKMCQLKVHKRENFLGFDFEICTFS